MAKSFSVDVYLAAFREAMGMASGEVVPNDKLTGSEVHLVGPGEKGENVGSFTFNTDKSGNASPKSGHAHPDYVKKT